MQRERDRIHRAGDELGSGACRLERRGECVAGGSLAIDSDREPGRFAQARHQLACTVRLQRAGRVVQEHARRPEVRQLAGLLHQRIGLAGAAGAVDEAGLELAPRAGDRVGSLAQVRDVVQRVVEAEHVDAVRGGGGDEAADEVVVDRTQADEEPPSKGQSKWGLDARLERADPFPRALDSTPDRAVETAAARHLEVGEAGPVEDLGDA